MMKTFLYKGTAFLLSFVIIYGTLFILLTNVKLGGSSLIYHTSNYLSWKGGGTYKKFSEFNVNTKYDVIVVGSSHAYRGYDPRIFAKQNIKMYNLGTSGQAMINTKHIVQDYITAANCKLLIVDIYEGVFSGDGLESASDMSQNISQDYTAAKISFALKDPRGLNMFALRLAQKKSKSIYSDSAYAVNGYSSIADSASSLIKYKGKEDSFTGNKSNFDALINIIDFTKEHGIEMLLVQHPMPKEHNPNAHNHFVKELEKTIGNTVYLDYSYTHSLHHQNHFADHNHLNQAGVEVFNVELLKRIKGN
jgi:hypothetical protein